MSVGVPLTIIDANVKAPLSPKHDAHQTDTGNLGRNPLPIRYTRDGKGAFSIICCNRGSVISL
jgi:hypothetical protein